MYMYRYVHTYRENIFYVLVHSSNGWLEQPELDKAEVGAWSIF